MIEFVEQVRRHAANQAGTLPQLRIGRVTSVDAVKHAVKIQLYPGETQTGWVPSTTLSSGALQIAAPLEVGSFIVAMPQEGDSQHWIVIGCLYSKREMPPVSPATGQPVQPGEFGAFLPGGNYLHMTANAIFLRGNLQVDGSITSNGDVSDKHGSLDRLRGHYNGHAHGGVTPGGGTTAATNTPDPE